jgi:ornithine cyclodeaminase/alanine dehydrogenase-like protein (mu-crystallin family)
MPLFITEAEVNSLVTMDDALECVERAFRLLGEGRGRNTPRQRPALRKTMLQIMGAGLEGVGFGMKAYTVAQGKVRFVVLLWDERSGDLLAVIEASRLGQLRTGAAGGVSAKYLARADSRQVGLFGTGYQAHTMLEAVCRVLPVERVKVYSPNAQHRKRFSEEMNRALSGTSSGIQATVIPVSNPDSAVSGADVIITITDSKQPVMKGKWVREGMHIIAAGSNRASASEIDLETIRKADLVAIDDKEQALDEAGDLIQAVNDGILTWDSLIPFADIVVNRAQGRKTNREGETQITIFESLGIAAEDLSLARLIYDRAVKRNFGRELPETILG